MPLKFPNDLPSKYHCSIQFYDYRRPDPFSSLMTLQQTIGPGRDGIVLPLPAQLIDSQKLNWAQTTSPIGEAVTDAFQGDLAGAAQAGGAAILNGMGQLAQGAAMGSDFATMAAGLIGGSISDSVKVALQKAGLALNPVLTQQFNHPEFKSHQFSWKFAPDSIDESGTLEAIIDAIKYNSLPDVSAGGMFFNYPSIALIKMHTGTKELYKFKPSVINDITVNYAPTNTPAFHVGTAAPSLVQVTISFIEIVLNTRKNTALDNRNPFDISFGNNIDQYVNQAVTTVGNMIRGGRNG